MISSSCGPRSCPRATAYWLYSRWFWQSSPSPEEAFQAYQATRRPMVHFYWRLTRFLTPFFQSDGWLLGWGRDRFLPWLPVVPWTRRQMVLTMAGLKQGWLKGR